MKWLSIYWWRYLLTGVRGWRNFFCRAKGHPDGPIFHNPGGTEPNWRCVNCGEYLG